MQDTTFIYTLNDPDTGVVRYVGKTDYPTRRLAAHLTDRVRCHRTNWIGSLKKLGKFPILEVLDEVPCTEWEFWEQEYIKVFRAIGLPLVNQTEGGLKGPWQRGERCPHFGKPGAWKGRKHTPQTIRRMSEQKKGKKFTPEHCIALSLAWESRPPTASDTVDKLRKASCEKGPSSRNTSGYKGVSPTPRGWMARAHVDGRYQVLGTFPDRMSAARAYDVAVRKFYPPGSYLNFPNEG